VSGGNVTAYAYPVDPLNQLDLDGRATDEFDRGSGGCVAYCDEASARAVTKVHHKKKKCGWRCRIHRANRIMAGVATVACFAGPMACGVAGGISLVLSVGDRIASRQNMRDALIGGGLDVLSFKIPAARYRGARSMRIGRLRFTSTGWRFSGRWAAVHMANYGRSWTPW